MSIHYSPNNFYWTIVMIGSFLSSLFGFNSASAADQEAIYNIPFELSDGTPTSLSQYKGRVLLLANTASNCGFTSQYEGLQSLHEKYESKGLTVLAFPANNFGGQEPGSNEEIQAFCEGTYNVTFPIAAKVSVKGNDQHPLFTHLTSSTNGSFRGPILWNFEKFLINKEGELVRRFRSITSPESPKITKQIDKLLE